MKYLVIAVATGEYRVDADDLDRVLKAIELHKPYIVLEEITGMQVYIMLDHIEALYVSTPETRQRHKEIQEEIDGETDKEDWQR